MRAWPVVRAAAVGLLIAGAATAVVAAFGLPEDRVQPHPGIHGFRVIVVLTLLALVLWGVAALMVEVDPSSGDGRRGLLGLALLGAGGGVAWTVVGLVQQWNQGFPGAVRMVGAIGSAAMAVGLLPHLLARRPAARLRRRVRAASASAGAVVVALVAGIMAPITPDLTLQARTSAFATPAPVPRAVSRVAWRTPMPGTIYGLAAGGAGVVVTLDDGAEGVDGVTGAVRWVYRHPGAEDTRVQVSPDGRTVLVGFDLAPTLHPQVVLLDADTGRVRYRFTPERPEDTDITAVSDRVWVSTSEGTHATAGTLPLVGRSVLDDRVLWRYRPPAGCVRDHNVISGVAAVRSGVVVLEQCGQRHNQFHFVDLGPSGRPRWQRVITEPGKGENQGALTFDATPDGSVVAANLFVSRPALDGATGARLEDADLLYGRYVGVPFFPSTRTIGNSLVDLRTGRRVAPVPDAEHVALLATQTAWPGESRPLPEEDGELLLRARSGAVHKVRLLPVERGLGLVLLLAVAPGGLVAADEVPGGGAPDELIGLR